MSHIAIFDIRDYNFARDLIPTDKRRMKREAMSIDLLMAIARWKKIEDTRAIRHVCRN